MPPHLAITILCKRKMRHGKTSCGLPKDLLLAFGKTKNLTFISRVCIFKHSSHSLLKKGTGLELSSYTPQRGLLSSFYSICGLCILVPTLLGNCDGHWRYKDGHSISDSRLAVVDGPSASYAGSARCWASRSLSVRLGHAARTGGRGERQPALPSRGSRCESPALGSPRLTRGLQRSALCTRPPGPGSAGRASRSRASWAAGPGGGRRAEGGPRRHRAAPAALGRRRRAQRGLCTGAP